MLRKTLSVVMCLLMLLSSASIISYADNATIGVKVAGTIDYDLAYEVFDEVNKYRASLGIHELKMDKEIIDYAMLRSAELTINLSHTRPNGTDCGTVFGGNYEFGAKAENIGAMTENRATAKGIVEAWKDSPRHHKNMISEDYFTVGIGCYNCSGIVYFVQLFSSERTKNENPRTLGQNKTIASIGVSPELFNINLDIKSVPQSENTYSFVFYFESSFTNEKEHMTYTVRTYLSPDTADSSNPDAASASVNMGATTVTVNTDDPALLTFDFNGVIFRVESPGFKQIAPLYDVKKGDWYYNGAQYCYERGYMNGTAVGRFSPNINMTRAMFVTILAKIADANTSSYTAKTFADVPEEQWYTKPVEWAFDNGYAAGTGKDAKTQKLLFSPNGNVTREQLAQFFYTYTAKRGWDMSAEDDLSSFVDRASVSTWALSAVKWAVGANLISGTGNNRVSPKMNATRAQIAVIVMNYVEKFDN